jgi:hypothetical protein
MGILLDSRRMPFLFVSLDSLGNLGKIGKIGKITVDGKPDTDNPLNRYRIPIQETRYIGKPVKVFGYTDTVQNKQELRRET